MYYALHNAAGIIRKVLKGPSLEWATLNRESEDELIFESETEIDNGVEKIENGQRVPYVPPKSLEDLQDEIVMNTQRRLDDFAKSRGYDNIMSACSYTTSTKPRFAAESQYAVEIRDETWDMLYQILAEVQSGVRPIPSGYADIESDLPLLEWPSMLP